MKVKTEEKSFVRDIVNGALLNTDNNALNLYKARRKQWKNQKELQERVDFLENLVIELLESRRVNDATSS